MFCVFCNITSTDNVLSGCFQLISCKYHVFKSWLVFFVHEQMSACLACRCFPEDRDPPWCNCAVLTQRVEMGGGSRNKELSCCLARRRQETEDEQQGWHLCFLPDVFPLSLNFYFERLDECSLHSVAVAAPVECVFLMGDSCCCSCLTAL